MAMLSDDDETFGEKLSIEVGEHKLLSFFPDMNDGFNYQDELDQFFMAVKYGLKQQLTNLLDKKKNFVDMCG